MSQSVKTAEMSAFNKPMVHLAYCMEGGVKKYYFRVAVRLHVDDAIHWDQYKWEENVEGRNHFYILYEPGGAKSNSADDPNIHFCDYREEYNVTFEQALNDEGDEVSSFTICLTDDPGKVSNTDTPIIHADPHNRTGVKYSFAEAEGVGGPGGDKA